MDFFVKKDYYNILGVNPNATPEEIKAAYRKLAKEFHPDLHVNNPLANLASEKFKEINEAYNTLIDTAKRKEYDSTTTKNQTPPPSDDNRHSTNKKDKCENNRSNTYKSDSRKYGTETKQHNFNSNYNNQDHRKTTKSTVGVCHIHADRAEVDKCIFCNAGLCQECAETFDKPLCPSCLTKNNDMYIKTLKAPLYFSLIIFVVGTITGVIAGLKFNILEDYGILEGIFLGLYFTCFWLYIWYIAATIKNILFTILKPIFSLFDINYDSFMFFLHALTIVFGISIGWILGFVIGLVRLKRDYITYSDYKPEYIRVKNYIKENFKL